MSDIVIKARNHRPRHGTSPCSACHEWRKNVCPILVRHEEHSLLMQICGGCLRVALEVAVGGRKRERP